LVLIALVACHHRPPEADVLAPIGLEFARGTYDEGNQPLYLLVGDPLTTSVLRDVAWSGRYRIAPKGAPLFCPSTPAQGLPGYQLSLTLDTLMGDSAVASVRRFCSKGDRVISTGEHILLVRRGGKWEIGRVINGWESMLGMTLRRRLTNVAADGRPQVIGYLG
jgi:hypothetical protein